jgi:hypothetical protein
MIAGERPAGAVRTVHSRGKADDQEPGVGVSEGRHGLAVVPGIFVLHRVEKGRKARTAAATWIENAAHRGPIDSADRPAVVVMKKEVNKKRATRIPA